MNEKSIQEFNAYCGTIQSELAAFFEKIDYTNLDKAAELIEASKSNGGRLHISGIGKPAHISSYAASLISSTGTPAYYLDGTEAVHGSCGQLIPGDVVIFISNSGETVEMKVAVQAIKNNECAIIGISGNSASWLAKQSDVYIFAGVINEGGPLNRAPRASILAEALVLQALSVILQANANVTPQQYVKWHPGGKLGVLRNNE